MELGTRNPEPAVIDTRPLFRPLAADIVALLRRLPPEDWERPTVAGTWRVRHVVAHLLDTASRRVSTGRDAHVIPRSKVITSERDLVQLINTLNATWIAATERLSPRLLTELYAVVSGDLASMFETADLHARAELPVSWAGQFQSPAWLDIGREFTEIWHHGAQIRESVGAGPYSNPEWLRAVLAISVYALPHTYRNIRPRPGTTIVFAVTGASGGTWVLRRDEDQWSIGAGTDARATTRVSLSDDAAWRLLFNALPPNDAEDMVHIEGDHNLGRPLLRARSVIV